MTTAPRPRPRRAREQPRHRGLTTYVVTFVALLVLTTLTFGLSFLPHAAWTVPVTVAIAVTKSTLIALFFMHLIEEPVSSWASMLVAVLLVATLLTLVLLDVASRWIELHPAG
jgi:cytochrome c oxidase subunit IV